MKYRIVIFCFTFFLLSLINSRADVPLVSVSDNRLPSKPIHFNVKLDHVEYRCSLSHFKWHELKYSDQIMLEKGGYFSIIDGGMTVNDTLRQKGGELLALGYQEALKRTSVKTSPSFGYNIVIEKELKYYVYYYQEILTLEITGNKDSNINFLIPTNHTATVVIARKQDTQ